MRWSVNDFHIQLLVIELLFCWRLQKRNRFALFFLPLTALYCLLPYAIPGGYFNGYLRLGWFTFGFLGALLLSAGVLFACFRMTVKQLIFYCCVAHTLQHMAHCASRIVLLGFQLPQDGIPSQLVMLSSMAIITAGGYLLLKEQFRASETLDVKSADVLAFAVASTFVIYFASLWTTSTEAETVGKEIYDLMFCTLLLLCLFDVFRIRRAEREQLIMLRLLRQEQEQHRLSRSTVEVINRKCHDLKHQISALRHMTEEERRKSIAELEGAVLIYDSFPKTGNGDLDILLAEKSLLAEKQSIRLQCIVRGEALAFLPPEDLYSLMGNALDNALEAAAREPSEEKRIIELNVATRTRGQFLTIHLSNPCLVQPAFSEGLPVTTKQDRDYHGYGMRSMRYIAERHGGALTTGWEDGIFSLNIIFPLEPAEEVSG